MTLEKDARLYEASLTTLLSRTRSLADARNQVGLVGHNPGFGERVAKGWASHAGMPLIRLMERKKG